MGKFRKGNYVFLSWKGDHSPKHVHVYRLGKLVLKWDLDNGIAMKGRPTKKILGYIKELQQEGKL
jgi:hypothetical protein